MPGPPSQSYFLHEPLIIDHVYLTRRNPPPTKRNTPPKRKYYREFNLRKSPYNINRYRNLFSNSDEPPKRYGKNLILTSSGSSFEDYSYLTVSENLRITTMRSDDVIGGDSYFELPALTARGDPPEEEEDIDDGTVPQLFESEIEELKADQLSVNQLNQVNYYSIAEDDFVDAGGEKVYTRGDWFRRIADDAAIRDEVAIEGLHAVDNKLQRSKELFDLISMKSSHQPPRVSLSCKLMQL